MSKTKRMAECHPDRPHYAKGLCRSCYRQMRRIENLEAYRTKEQKWRDENREHHRETQRKWRENNPDWMRKYLSENSERIKERRKEYFRRRIEDDPDFIRRCHLQGTFGITLEEYNDLLEAQDGVCAICGKTPEENGRSLAVDHCHKTGKIRGLLCQVCNAGLGSFKDNQDILRKAIEYLDDRD